MNIFGDNSRWQHCKAGFWIAACLTILCTLGAMSGAEFKDEKHGGKWDWSDWGWGMLGGVAGQIVQIIIIYVLWILA